MNIHKRKLIAAGIQQYCNIDPFSAGSMGQVAPMIADDDRFGGAPGAARSMESDPTAAQGSYVPNSGAANVQDAGNSFAKDPTIADESSSPLDNVYNSIYNSGNGGGNQGTQQPTQQPQPTQAQAPQGGQQPAQQPSPTPLDIGNLNMESLMKHAGNLDFSSGISQSTLDKFAINEETGTFNDLMGGLMEMMNHMGRNVYANSLKNGGALFNQSFDNRFNSMQQSIPQLMNRVNVATQVENKGYHKSLTPIVSNAAKEILRNNPNITPEAASEMVDSLIENIGQHLQQQYAADDTSEKEQSAGSSIFGF